MCACWCSDRLRSTAARIQVTRGIRSKYRQSGVFIVVTHHISKLFRVFVLTLLPQKSDTIPIFILCFEDKVHLVLVHYGKTSGTKSLSSSVFSNLTLNLNFPRVAFFLIPSLLTSPQLEKHPRV